MSLDIRKMAETINSKYKSKQTGFGPIWCDSNLPAVSGFWPQDFPHHRTSPVKFQPFPCRSLNADWLMCAFVITTKQMCNSSAWKGSDERQNGSSCKCQRYPCSVTDAICGVRALLSDSWFRQKPLKGKCRYAERNF